MKNKTNHNHRESWLEQAYPEVHYLLVALEGNAAGLSWLDRNSKGVAELTRAMTGDRQALATLESEEPADLDDLFGVIDNEDLSDWLRERKPEVHRLFEAIKGEPGATAELKKHKPSQAKLVGVVRRLHEQYLAKTQDGTDPLDGRAAADMGCLIGEMHLKAGEFEKAIEAFTRAIQTRPAPDLYEGRARAYQGLAERDERQAAQLRQQA